MDGSAAETLPALQHRESLQAMPLARWLLLTVVLFSIQSTTNIRRKPSVPWSRTTDFIYKAKKHWESRIKVWDLLAMPNDQVMRMPRQATKTTLVSVQALWVQNAHSNRGMTTVQPWHCWQRYKKAQPWVPEFVLAIADTIFNILFGQNFRTQHIICMCPVLTSLVPCPLRKDVTLTQLENNTFYQKFCQKAFRKKREGKISYNQNRSVRSVAPAPLPGTTQTPWRNRASFHHEELLFEPPPRAEDAVLCVTTQRHSAHTVPRGKPAGFFPITRIPTSIYARCWAGRAFRNHQSLKHNVEPAEMVKHLLWQHKH